MPLPSGVTAVFPFSPNWTATVKEHREFKTDIITSRDGTEQRRALRSKPREVLNYQILLEGDDAARFDYFLWALQPHVLMLPLWPRKRLLNEAAGLGAVSLVLDQPAPENTRVGDEWVLLQGDQDPEVVTLLSVSADFLTLELSAPLESAWSKSTEIYPAWRAQLSGDIRANKLSGSVVRAPLEFKRLVDERPPVGWSSSAELTVDGLEVLLRQLNWNKSVSVEHQWSAELVDVQIGPFSYEAAGDLPGRVYKGTALAIGRADIDWYQAFFDRVRGRQVPFLMPTWQDDLKLHTPLGITAFEVPGIELGRYMPEGPIHTHLMIRKLDGSLAFFSIQSIDMDTVLGVTGITTVEPWVEAYGPESCPLVCFVNTVRLVSDTLAVEWVTDELANINFAAITVEAVI